MTWTLATGRGAMGIDWWADFQGAPVDPYLIWFDQVGSMLISPENFERWYSKKLPLLLELKAAFDEKLDPRVEVPAIYNLPLGDKGPKAHFVSARVSPEDIHALFQSDSIKRFQLELSRIRATDTTMAERQSQDKSAKPPPEPEGSQTWLGVIDMGCAFAHQKFRIENPGQRTTTTTRVRRLWDQSPTREAGQNNWIAAKSLGYGAELGPIQFDLAMADFESEAASYAEVGCESLLDARAQHGFGVLDLAAGRPSPLVVGPPALGGDPDAAGALPVVFVQLDSFDDRVTNINSLGVHVLDGLRWMIDRVESEIDKGGRPLGGDAKLVVNISYGGLAGPHDGSSILERAIDELIEKRKNLFVVVAAGNSHDPDLPTHARMMVKSGKPGVVLWRVEPDDPTDGFLEVWFPAHLSVTDREVRIRVTAPDGSTTEDIHPNQTWTLPARDDSAAGASAGAMFRSLAANGENSAMFLLAVQPTAPADAGLPAAQAGLWKVEVMCQGDADMEVHAWLERDDYVSGNLKRKQQSALIEPGGDEKTVSLQYGFSSLAHGKHTIVAGGYCLSDNDVSEDTASGPMRGCMRLREGALSTPASGAAFRCSCTRCGPDVSAPSDESRATPGLLVSGATTGVVNRMSGTSAAAPSVARWIANWCADVPGTVDIEMLRRAMDSLPGPDPVAGPPPGPEIVPGTVDSVYRLSRIRIDERLEPSLPLPDKTSPMRAPAS